MALFYKEQKDDVILKVLLFLISPLLSFFYSLRRIGTKSSLIVLFLFCIVFGVCFTVSERKDTSRLDGAAYRYRFEVYCNTSTDNSLALLIHDYMSSDNEDIKDLYADVVSILVSDISYNYHVLFGVYAFVFALFMVGSYKFLVTERNFLPGSWVCFLLAVLFGMNSIFNINGVRFWTALWVAIYSIFQIFVKERKMFFVLLATTIFIHSSYIVLVPIVFLSYFLYKPTFVIMRRIWLISVVLSPFFIIVMQNVSVDFLPPIFAKMLNAYTNEEAIKEYQTRMSSSAFFIISTIFNILRVLYINYMVLLLSRSNEIMSSPKTKKIFGLLVVWLVFSNLAMSIPSLGVRFVYILYPIIAYLWIVAYGTIRHANVIRLFPVFFLMDFYNYLVLYSLVLEPRFYYMNVFSLLYHYLIVG